MKYKKLEWSALGAVRIRSQLSSKAGKIQLNKGVCFMKKSEQMAINAKVENMVSLFAKTLANEGTGTSGVRRLRTCSAEVYRVGTFWALRSYNTTIAIIDTETDTLYDFLRLVYGYTATSAQHISKFSKDYGEGKWGCAHEMRYYRV